MSTATITAPAPFVADRKLRGRAAYEQVRHLMPEFLAARADLIATGRGSEHTCYNADFVGKLPSLATTDERNTESAIYYLQTLRRLDEEGAAEVAALADGFERIAADDPRLADGALMRGTVIKRAWYMGGTGWRKFEDVRLGVTATRFPTLFWLPKGRRTNGFSTEGGYVLFRPATATKGGK